MGDSPSAVHVQCRASNSALYRSHSKLGLQELLHHLQKVPSFSRHRDIRKALLGQAPHPCSQWPPRLFLTCFVLKNPLDQRAGRAERGNGCTRCKAAQSGLRPSCRDPHACSATALLVPSLETSCFGRPGRWSSVCKQAAAQPASTAPAELLL